MRILKACAVLISLVFVAWSMTHLTVYLNNLLTPRKSTAPGDGPIKKKHDWHDKLSGKLGRMGMMSPEVHQAAFDSWNATRNPNVPTYS